MSKNPDFYGSDEDDKTSYVYGSESDGFTKVTYGTPIGTSYEYFPPAKVDNFAEDVILLDPLRPRSVEDDLAGE